MQELVRLCKDHRCPKKTLYQLMPLVKAFPSMPYSTSPDSFRKFRLAACFQAVLRYVALYLLHRKYMSRSLDLQCMASLVSEHVCTNSHKPVEAM